MAPAMISRFFSSKVSLTRATEVTNSFSFR